MTRTPSSTSRDRFEGVLLDLFGTLVPAAPGASRAPHLHEMARILEVDPNRFEQDWAGSFELRCVGALGPLDETIRRIAGRQGARPRDEAVRRAQEVRLAFSRRQLDACSPVLPGLMALRAAGLRLAVVSDCSEEPALLWSSTPLGGLIDVTVFSCREGFCKPDPRAYGLALTRLGLESGRCAFVGDGGSRELTGAEHVGLAAFQYRFPDDPPGVESRYDPDLAWRGVVLAELGDLLRTKL